MLGKGVRFSDCLVALAIVLPIALLVGAALGYFGNRFGLSGGLRLVFIVALAGIAGQIARVVVNRRVQARSASRPHS